MINLISKDNAIREKDKFWILETYGDDDEIERIVIEDEEENISYNFNSEALIEKGFLKETFNRLKEFVENEKNDRG